MSSINSQVIIFTSEDGKVSVEAHFDTDTTWLSLEQMATLFDRDKSTISRHIKKIFEEGELQRDGVVANYATTAADGTVLLIKPQTTELFQTLKQNESKHIHGIYDEQELDERATVNQQLTIQKDSCWEGGKA
jgi:hypothetical protein